MKISGIYKYEVAQEELESAVTDQWGGDIPEEEIGACRQRTQEHFDSLYLIEIELEEQIAGSFDWSSITQDNGDLQAPYDEQAVDGAPNRWTFFYHFLDLTKPLKTPFGDTDLPKPTPRPKYLSHMQYLLP